MSVLPVGFSWAMCFAQAVHEEAVNQASLVSSRQVFHSHRPAPLHTTASPTVLPYADHCNVVGSSALKVQETKDSVAAALRLRRLPVHEELEAASSADPLGVHLDGVDLLVRPTSKRRWRLYLGLGELFATAVLFRR